MSHTTILCRDCGAAFVQIGPDEWSHACPVRHAMHTVEGTVDANVQVPTSSELKRQIAREETPGTPATPGMLLLGNGTPERVTLPTGARVMSAEETRRFGSSLPSVACDGPDCPQRAPLVPYPPNGWISQYRYRLTGQAAQHRLFCSLYCLAAWLVGELAKEEESDE